MARYVYDENKVNEALDTLKNATKKLSTTASGFSSALSEIASASKGYLWIDTQTLPAIPDQVTSTIEEIMSDITAKQTAIEEYDASPWYEKIFGSTGMIFTKIGEGLGTAGEQLLDGAFTIVGFGVGLFSSEMQSSISEFIEKDHVGDFFYEQYESGALQWINDKSFFSHTSTAANVFKGVGVAAGYVLAAAATGGIGGIGGSGIAAGAASGASSLGLNAAIAGVGGIGTGTQSGLQNNLSFNEAALQGVEQGALQAGTVFVTGKAIDKISSSGIVQKAADKVGSKILGREVVESLATEGATPTRYVAEVLKTKAGNAASKVATAAKTAGSKIDDAVGSKILGKEVVESLATEGVSPAKYAAEVLTTKAGNAASKVATAAKTAGSKIDDAVGSKILGKEVVESLATEGVSPAKYAAEVLTTKAGNAASKVATAAKTAGSKIDDAIGTGVLGKDAMNALKLDGGNFTRYVGSQIGSAAKNLGTTTAGATITGNITASGINQSIAQNANAQFKVKMDPDNNIGLNTDYSQEIAAKNEIPEESTQGNSESPLDTIPIESTEENPPAQPETTGEKQNRGGDQITTDVGSSSGTIATQQPSQTSQASTASSTNQFRIEEPTKAPTSNNNQNANMSEINTTQPVQDTTTNTSNNTSVPGTNTGNNTSVPGTNTGNNTSVPETNTSTNTSTPESNLDNTDSNTSVTLPSENTPTVPETPNSNPPTENIEGNITDIADNIAGETNGNTNGNYNNGGSSYSNSIIGGLNNNGSQLGPEGELSYENKPESGILDANDSMNTIDKGNSLDVISIDKDTSKSPSTSNGGSSVIPTILGVGAAGAAGVAGIHYVQKKFGKDNEYYEDESSEENNDNNGEYNVSTNDSINISDEPTGMIEEIPKYKAGGINQLKLDDGADVKINDNNNIIAPQAQEELE